MRKRHVSPILANYAGNDSVSHAQAVMAIPAIGDLVRSAMAETNNFMEVSNEQAEHAHTIAIEPN